MKKKLVKGLLIFSLMVMSLSLVGCSSDTEEPADKAVETTEQDLAMVKASARLAEEKILIMFDTYTPDGSDVEILVAKERYTTTDGMKTLLNAYYTEEMTNQVIEAYVKPQDVAGLGNVLTLNQPEDYVTIIGHEFTETDTVTVEGDKATITFTANDKNVTYTLVKVENTWKVETKTVE